MIGQSCIDDTGSAETSAQCFYLMSEEILCNAVRSSQELL